MTQIVDQSLFIDSSGNVGVGTPPGALLHTKISSAGIPAQFKLEHTLNNTAINLLLTNSNNYSWLLGAKLPAVCDL